MVYRERRRKFVRRNESAFFYLLSIKNLQYWILTTLLTEYSTTLQIKYHEEQDIMSTPWGKRRRLREKKQNYIELHSKRKFTKKGTWWLLDGWQKFGRIQSNRPVSWMKCRVNSMTFLLISSGKSFLPYINGCVKTSFEGFLSPNGRTNARTPARRFRRWDVKRWTEQQTMFHILNTIV